MNRKRKKLSLGGSRNKSSVRDIRSYLNISEKDFQVLKDFLKITLDLSVVVAFGCITTLFLLIVGG